MKTTLAQAIDRAEDDALTARALAQDARRELSAGASPSVKLRSAQLATRADKAERELAELRFVERVDDFTDGVQNGEISLDPALREAARRLDGRIDTDRCAALHLERAGVPLPASWRARLEILR